MRKFIVHAGFHKTATTTVQKTLEQHAALLSPHIEYLDRSALKPVRKAAQVYSGSREPVDLAVFEMRLCELLADLDASDQRPVLMSSEDFSGYLIGRSGVTTYSAAIPLIAVLKKTISLVFQEPAGLTVYFSTRKNGWHKSCYGQLSKGGEVQITLKDFSQRFAEASNFEAIVTQVRSEINPSPVHSLDIEDLTGPLGPLQPLVDLCELPGQVQSRIVLLPPQNVANA